MADPTSESPQTPPRRRRRRTERNERRRRLALLLLLLALATGAVVLAPGLVELIELGRPAPGPLRQPPRVARSDRPIPLRNWRFDFSMGPILELIEQSLRLEPFDMRRPLRIPFAADWAPRLGGQILLSDPASYRPSFVPGSGGPTGNLPPAFQIAWMDRMPPIMDPGSGIPNGQPEFDPELANSDDKRRGPPFKPPGPPPHKPPHKPPGPPPDVPEPGMGLMLAAVLLGGAALRRERAGRG
jgi:hypothetical protein